MLTETLNYIKKASTASPLFILFKVQNMPLFNNQSNFKKVISTKNKKST
jgi:hypothetical protein